MWNKLCRACLSTKESFTYVLTENVSSETYFFCTSIQVQQEDHLPKALCNSCYELVSRYSKFKKMCIASQNTLLHCSSPVKTEQRQENTQTDANVAEDVQDIQNVFESVETKFGGSINFVVKEEDLSDHFIEHSTPEFSDMSIENLVLTPKRKKLKNLKHKSVKCKIKLESAKKKLLYSCELCHKKFKYRKRYETHKLDHNEERRNLQCLPCNKTFVTSSGLKRHEESAHVGVRLASVACARCGRVCASRRGLRAHEAAHGGGAHGGGARARPVCHVCGKRVSSTVILRGHLETHKVDRERRHTCEHCGKKFFTNTILLSHIKRLHTGLRYICGVCEYPFTDKYNLAKHLLIHDGKKLYKCDICRKSYATNGSLVEHKRTHSGERPFNCSYCPKSFLSKRRLMDHHRIHTGDKPHRCEVCEQRFTQRGTLKRHMKVHDPIKAPQVT